MLWCSCDKTLMKPFINWHQMWREISCGYVTCMLFIFLYVHLCSLETCSNTKHPRMHIHLPQQPYFFHELWSYFVCAAPPSLVWEYENALRKHLYNVCISASLGEKRRSSPVLSLVLEMLYVCMSDPCVAPFPSSRKVKWLPLQLSIDPFCFTKRPYSPWLIRQKCLKQLLLSPSSFFFF